MHDKKNNNHGSSQCRINITNNVLDITMIIASTKKFNFICAFFYFRGP